MFSNTNLRRVSLQVAFRFHSYHTLSNNPIQKHTAPALWLNSCHFSHGCRLLLLPESVLSTIDFSFRMDCKIYVAIQRKSNSIQFYFESKHTENPSNFRRKNLPLKKLIQNLLSIIETRPAIIHE